MNGIHTVKRILELVPDARCDDMVLYYNYVKVATQHYDLTLEDVFKNPKARAIHGVKGFSSVSRMRRLLQARYQELQATEETKELRRMLCEWYRIFAKKPWLIKDYE